MVMTELEPIVNAPYAQQSLIADRVVATCPRCSAVIELKRSRGKTFETVSTEAYERHYFSSHAIYDGLIKQGGHWFRRRARRTWQP
jgi:hypothetical protein